MENEWFFYDDAFNTTTLESGCNTWLHENFVAVYNIDEQVDKQSRKRAKHCMR